ncbi:hypothetical protein AKJ09_10444 [Labilithrix luteola]|uniref:PEGA domain-containing protein n=1 Tax=Labilithrix luteola TaxID=1391654 RepID=A0A0K1QDD5_9BACT|nr:hypothetical protein AKJ09_10444 [Labilithrix luteola]
MELADDGQFDAALVELKKAYDLAPSYRLLYNVGIVYQQLKDYARALDAYERYVEEGGAGIAEDRLADVNARIERLKGRVGHLDIRTTEPGAEVTIDDRVVGTTPLRPVRVNSGQRKVTVHLAGRPAQSRILDLAGGETKVTTFDLVVASTTPPPEPKSIVPWVSWGATLAVAGGAVATGIIASNKADKYDQLENQFNVDKATLDSAKSNAHTFGLVTDVLGAVAIVGVGISTYFTIKPPKVSRETPPKVSFHTNGLGGGLQYRF